MFLVVLALLGGFRIPVRLVTAFTLGQVAAVLAVHALKVHPGPIPVEIGFGLGVAILAGQALKPAGARRGLTSLAAAAGVVHGAGIGALLTDRDLVALLTGEPGIDFAQAVRGELRRRTGKDGGRDPEAWTKILDELD